MPHSLIHCCEPKRQWLSVAVFLHCQLSGCRCISSVQNLPIHALGLDGTARVTTCFKMKQETVRFLYIDRDMRPVRSAPVPATAVTLSAPTLGKRKLVQLLSRQLLCVCVRHAYLLVRGHPNIRSWCQNFDMVSHISSFFLRQVFKCLASQKKSRLSQFVKRQKLEFVFFFERLSRESVMLHKQLNEAQVFKGCFVSSANFDCLRHFLSVRFR